MAAPSVVIAHIVRSANGAGTIRCVRLQRGWLFLISCLFGLLRVLRALLRWKVRGAAARNEKHGQRRQLGVAGDSLAPEQRQGLIRALTFAGSAEIVSSLKRAATR